MAFCWQGRSGKKELQIDVAAFGDLSYVVAGASERLLPPHLATELLIAVVVVLDVWRLRKRLPTTPTSLAIEDLDAEIPETARLYLVRPQTLLGFELLGVPDAGLRAVALVVAAVVVEDVVDDVGKPECRSATADSKPDGFRISRIFPCSSKLKRSRRHRIWPKPGTAASGPAAEAAPSPSQVS